MLDKFCAENLCFLLQRRGQLDPTEVLNQGQLAAEEELLLSMAFGAGSQGTCCCSLQHMMPSSRTSPLL